MKKSILLATLLAVSIAAQAQVPAGSVMLGGALSVRAESPAEDESILELNVIPRVGFIADNLVVGAGVGYALIQFRDESGSRDFEDRTNLILVNPFARYFFPLGDGFAAYLEGDIRVGFGSSEGGFDGNTSDGPRQRVLGVGINPGVTFFPSPRVGIDLAFTGIDYQRQRDLTSDGDNVLSERSTWRIGPNLMAPRLGVHLFL